MKDGQMTFKDVALGNLSTFNIMGTVVTGYEIGAINPAVAQAFYDGPLRKKNDELIATMTFIIGKSI